MYFKNVVSIFLLCILFIGCDRNEQKIRKTTKNSLSKAYILYDKQKFIQAAKQFALFFKTSIDKNKYNEAQLGLIACQLLSHNGAWEKSIHNWKIENRGYWKGKSFTLFENIPRNRKEHFIKYGKHRFFLFLQFLINHNHIKKIPLLINKIQNKKIALDFCIINAWQKLKKNKKKYAKSLFLMIESNKFVSNKQKKESITGINLINVLEKNYTFFKRDMFSKLESYSIGLRNINICDKSSPLHVYKKLIQHLPDRTYILVGDMIYNFGRSAHNTARIWEEGINFISHFKAKFNDKVFSCLLTRFKVLIAWRNFIKGKLTESSLLFKECLKNKISKECEKEIKLGIVLIGLKQGEDYQELRDILLPYKWSKDYWLLRKKINFYRLANRRKDRNIIEKICLKKSYRIDYIVLDVLCQLGDGREAHSFLGKIIYNGSRQIKKLYLKEVDNIPTNPYAENQIWEK